MSTQDQVDADTQAVQQVATDLETARTSIQTELDNLQSQIDQGGKPTDLSALTAAIGQLDPAVQAVGALTPSKPAETPAVETPSTETGQTPEAPATEGAAPPESPGQ